MTQANQGSAMPGNGLDGSSPDGNFISRFLGWCEDSPERTALSAMEGHHEVRLSYRQLAAEAAFWQQYWQKQGFSRGDRVVMALQPGLHTYAITISLLGMGLVPVYIDVAMPRHHIRYVLEGSSAVAIIGLRRALRWHWLVPELKQCQRLSIDGPFPGVVSLPVKMARLARDEGSRKLVAEACPAEAHGIISFTSENRGIPMGADRTHGSLQQLHLAMERFWPLPVQRSSVRAPFRSGRRPFQTSSVPLLRMACAMALCGPGPSVWFGAIQTSCCACGVLLAP